MQIRNLSNPIDLNGLSLVERRSIKNLYPTAYPFDRCGYLESPSPVAAVTIQGRAGGVTSTVDCWPAAIVRTFPTAGFTVGISSSSANDTATGPGTGANVVEVDIVDTDGAAHTLTMNLAGQTRVLDTLYVNKAIRINDVRIKTFGTGAANAGDIYAYDGSDAPVNGVPPTATKIFQKILAGENQCRGAFYRVPKGCEAMITQVRAGFDDNSVASRAGNVLMIFRNPAGALFSIPIVGQISNNGPELIKPDFPIIVPEGWDVTARVAASASSSMVVSADAIIYHK